MVECPKGKTLRDTPEEVRVQFSPRPFLQKKERGSFKMEYRYVVMEIKTRNTSRIDDLERKLKKLQGETLRVKIDAKGIYGRCFVVLRGEAKKVEEAKDIVKQKVEIVRENGRPISTMEEVIAC